MNEEKILLDYLQGICKKSKSDLELHFDGDCHNPQLQWHLIIRYPVSYKNMPSDNTISESLHVGLIKLKEKAHAYLHKPAKNCNNCKGTGIISAPHIISAPETLCDCNFPEPEPRNKRAGIASKKPIL